MAFGGKPWPINAKDMNLGQPSPDSPNRIGGIFDLNAGSNIGGGGGNYSDFRSQPAAIGFAELSDTAGGSLYPRSTLAKDPDPQPVY